VFCNQVSDKAVKDAFQRLVKHQLLGGIRVAASGVVIVTSEQVHALRDLLDGQQARFVAVVQVGGAVAISSVRSISCASSGGRSSSRYSLSSGLVLRGVVVRVLDDAFAYFESQIQSPKRRVTKFEVLDNPQRVQVVIER